MSNLLKVAMIELILSLHRQGLSQRRIARELGVNRETVARYLGRAKAESKPANAPSGSIAAAGRVKTSQCALRLGCAGHCAGRGSRAPGLTSDYAGRCRGRTSECERWRDIIQSKCDLGLSARRIYQDLTPNTTSPAPTTASGASSAGWSLRESCRFAASSAGLAMKPRSISAKAPRSSAPTANAARRISFASCCLTAGRPTARLSTARPPTTFSAVSRMPFVISAECPGA